MPQFVEPKNVAIVHDWLVDYAGAERVLERILAIFPGAVLYTLIDRMPSPDRERFAAQRTVTSFLDRLPSVQRYFTRCLPLMPLAVQQFDLSGHDLVISASHCVAKGVIVPPEALHLCYCHSPMRYAWDMQAAYLKLEGLDRGLKSVLARLMLHRLRQWDAASANGVDHFAANSSFVRQRILKAYRRTATVIHPPVQVPMSSDALPSKTRQVGHYVTVGRLMGYKNVELMLHAFALLPDRRLTVVGGGPLLSDLKGRAPANVDFTGPLPEADKAALLRTACAFVFAAVEDFGIAPVEALAAGTPVIALRRGGALDYLRHGYNAWLFDEATPEGLANAIRLSEGSWHADVQARCNASALAYTGSRFEDEFSAWVSECWLQWQGQNQTLSRPSIP